MTTDPTTEPEPSEPGGIYILENEALPPNVIKIGKTGQRDWTNRIRQLNTAVPLTFTCFKASRVDNISKVETFLHQTFQPAKHHWAGEFYEVESWRVAQVLSIFELEDITALAPQPDASEERAINAGVRVKETRDPFTFKVAGIPIGAKLGFKGKPDIEVEVVDDHTTISYQGQTYSMSALVTQIKEKDYVVQGIMWWTYQGETLQKMRNRIEAEAEQRDVVEDNP